MTESGPAGRSGWRRRDFLKGTGAAGVMAAASRLVNDAAGASHATPGRAPAAAGDFNLTGWIRGYLDGITDNWLKVAPASNPAILEMFHDRNREPLRDLVPWAGEFAGKYLTSAASVHRMTADPQLREVIVDFVRRLRSLQDRDGYLGPWPDASKLTGRAPNCARGRGTWDAWGHYHVMLGLLRWNEQSGDAEALACARRIGRLLCTTFEARRLVDIGSTEMNLAPIHSLCLLHRRTGDARFLRAAQRIRDEFAATDEAGRALAGNYLKGPLSGLEFYQLPKPRWEGLHSVQGMGELGSLTGDADCRRAFERIWWSIAQWDRHNNGGFSSGEKACGNPYDPRPIETCCTVAWTALGVDMLHLTHNPVVADELELSTLNSLVGLHSPNGRWSTYNTPMDGVRKSNCHDIVFQARAGSPELNCCSVNAARGLGMIAEWAVVPVPEGMLLNWYGPGTIRTALGDGTRVELEQETGYPREGRTRIRVLPERTERFSLGLRIPHWSHRTGVRVNGRDVAGVQPGRYLPLERKWTRGDTIKIDFDFSLQFWAGERECEGKASIYRGPILLTYDRRFNAFDPDRIPHLDAGKLVEKSATYEDWLAPMLLVEYPAADGTPVRLCDFASAGAGGSPYRTWLEISGCRPTGFSRTNPRRTSAAA